MVCEARSYSYDYDNLHGPEEAATPRATLLLTESKEEALLEGFSCFWRDEEATVDALRNCFLIFDKDGDGSIGADELGSVLNNLGENATDDEVHGMLLAADEVHGMMASLVPPYSLHILY